MIFAIVAAVILFAIVPLVYSDVVQDARYKKQREKEQAKQANPKVKKQSKIRWKVVGTIIFVICIAILASIF